MDELESVKYSAFKPFEVEDIIYVFNCIEGAVYQLYTDPPGRPCRVSFMTVMQGPPPPPFADQALVVNEVGGALGGRNRPPIPAPCYSWRKLEKKKYTKKKEKNKPTSFFL